MEKLKFSVVTPKGRNVPQFTEIVRSGSEFVWYGTNNLFPNYLWTLYLKSPILSSIINGTADFVYGNGINLNSQISINSNYLNTDGDTLEDIIKKITIDYLIFGGIAIKVCKNSNGQISDIHWLDFLNVRINEDETVAYYYAKGMKKLENRETYPLYDNNVDYMTSILYFKGHITRSHYPIPRYVGALAAVETSTEISKFHLNTIHNNFSGSFIVNYNNTDFTEEQKKEIKKGIEDNFCGADNAGKFMLAFNANKDNAVSIARIPEDQFDKKYQALKESTMKDIFIAFRASQLLFGYTTEGTGFDEQEFSEAFKLYNKTTVKPILDDLVRLFDKLFGIPNSIVFSEFTLENGGSQLA